MLDVKSVLQQVVTSPMGKAREVPAQGPKNAKVMIVGEAPGADEEREGVPFVGASGLELTRMLAEAGFRRSECYVTNVCGVRPPGNEIKRFFGTKASGNPECMGRYPAGPIREGLSRLEREFREVNPILILAFGDTALWACTGLSGITKWRGSELELRAMEQLGGPVGQLPGPTVIPTYHPAAILRNWSWRYVAVQDLRRAKRLLDGGSVGPAVSQN